MLNRKPFVLSVGLLAASSGISYADELPGQQLALDVNKGNCHACHKLPGAERSGNIAPRLSGIAQKYPDIKQLQAFIHDPTLSNPNTIMPPYGRHGILTEQEIVEISKFIHLL